MFRKSRAITYILFSSAVVLVCCKINEETLQFLIWNEWIQSYHTEWTDSSNDDDYFWCLSHDARAIIIRLRRRCGRGRRWSSSPSVPLSLRNVAVCECACAARCNMIFGIRYFTQSDLLTHSHLADGTLASRWQWWMPNSFGFHIICHKWIILKVSNTIGHHKLPDESLPHETIWIQPN